MKKSKRYVEASQKVEKDKTYSISEAIKLVKDTTLTKFDGTIDVAFNLNVDPKKADQQLRGSLVLPNGTGKTQRILVIAEGDAAKEAESAGADFVGGNELIEKIEKEKWFDFDVIIATPMMMAKLGKIGKILGPKGLMPNPKTGTVTPNTSKAVEDIKKGMVEYKTDTFGNVHLVIGKVSFKEKALEENFKYVIDVITKAKPTAVKGTYIKNISISATMGPGVKIDLNSIDK